LPKSLFESDQPKYNIINITNYLCELTRNQYGILISQQLRKDIVDDVLKHYKLHVETYSVPVNGIDPYKFISWIGLNLYDRTLNEYPEKISDGILKSTIIVMNRTLVEEGRLLPKYYLRKLFDMVKNDYSGKEHLGLGKNGLYLVFRSASLCQLEETKYTIDSKDIENK